MPIYNGMEFLKESLPSIMAQTYEQWELLIGINGYPPNSEVFQKISEFNSQKIKVFDLPNTRGKSQTLNAMLEYTKYDLLCLLDVDDIWMPTKLEIQMRYIKDFDVVGTNARYFGNRNDQPIIPLNKINPSEFKIFNPIINSSAMFYKKDAHWDDIRGVEDYEMWCRLSVAGKKFYNVPEVLVKHRIHAGSAFNTEEHNKSIENIRTKYSLLCPK